MSLELFAISAFEVGRYERHGKLDGRWLDVVIIKS